jgi:hypothetical protein
MMEVGPAEMIIFVTGFVLGVLATAAVLMLWKVMRRP